MQFVSLKNVLRKKDKEKQWNLFFEKAGLIMTLSALGIN